MAWASAHPPTTLAELLAQETRPTMEQIEQIASQIQDEPGIPATVERGTTVPAFTELLLQYGPKLIASLEKTYPGATWVFAGRDVAAWADVVEEFYRQIGQTDRVVRLGASKETFNGASPDQLISLLESHGFSMKDVRKNPPFILIDTLSGGGGRQGRTLISAVYNRYAQDGGNPADLLRKVNMFGMLVSTFQGVHHPYENADQILRDEEKRYRAGQVTDYFAQHTVLTYPDPNPQRFANEAGYVHYSGAWHDSYGRLRADSQGHLHAAIGQAYPVAYRKTVLWLQKRVLLGVSDARFASQVEAEAGQLGYRFPRTRQAALAMGEAAPPASAPFAQTDERLQGQNVSAGEQARLRRLVDGMKRVEPVPSGMTANASALAGWHDQAVAAGEDPSLVAVLLAQAMREARDGRKIRSDDLPGLLTMVFRDAQPSSALAAEIEAFRKESTAFRDLIRRGGVSQVGTAGAQANFQAILDYLDEASTCERKLR
jgi:hypothetical protein